MSSAAAAAAAASSAQQQPPPTNANIFPVSMVLANAHNFPVNVELRTGASLIGTLSRYDEWMNLVLKTVTRVESDGKTQSQTPEVTIRGNSIRTVRVAPQAVKYRDPALDDKKNSSKNKAKKEGKNKKKPSSSSHSSGGGNKKPQQQKGGGGGGKQHHQKVRRQREE